MEETQAPAAPPRRASSPVVAPVRDRPAGSSTLRSLRELSPEAVAELNKAPSIPTYMYVDVSTWYVADQKGIPIKAIEVSSVPTGYARTMYISWLSEQRSFCWRGMRYVYSCHPDEHPGEDDVIVDRSYQFPHLSDKDPSAIDIPILHALHYLLSGHSTQVTVDAYALGVDPLAAIRDWSADKVAAFGQWAVYIRGSVTATTFTVLEMASLYESETEGILRGRLDWVRFPDGDGCGNVLAVSELSYVGEDFEDELGVPHWRVGDEWTANVMDRDGILHAHVDVKNFGVVPRSRAHKLMELAAKMSGAVVSKLNLASGGNTFADIEGFSMESLDQMIAFIGSDSVDSLVTWEQLKRGHTHINQVPISTTIGYEVSHWVDAALSKLVWAGAAEITSALRTGREISMDTIDISDFAKIEFPQNDLIESIKMLKGGTVRVILKDVVYPTQVLRRGITYIEDDAGSVLSDMSIRAFDLDFRGNLTKFPNATAYADEACKHIARHTNISSGGRVCLGNINQGMTEAEIAARGGFGMPSVGDFLQMLRQCNLDSAYHGGREFVLADPESVEQGHYSNAPKWRIPGLRRIEVDDFAELRKQFAAQAAAEAEEDGEEADPIAEGAADAEPATEAEPETTEEPTEEAADADN
jgi:hypothetical protein